jgi:hypothetical protein
VARCLTARPIMFASTHHHSTSYSRSVLDEWSVHRRHLKLRTVERGCHPCKLFVRHIIIIIIIIIQKIYAPTWPSTSPILHLVVDCVLLAALKCRYRVFAEDYDRHKFDNASFYCGFLALCCAVGTFLIGSRLRFSMLRFVVYGVLDFPIRINDLDW